MFQRKNFLIFIFFCILLCCGNSAAQVKGNDKLFITLNFSDEHMGTFYNLEIQANRKVVLKAISGTNVKGINESNINEDQYNLLISEINKSNFFSLEDSYTVGSKFCPWYMLNSPTVIISVKLNEKEKTITHYLGCGGKDSNIDSLESFPKPLFELEDKIIEIAKMKKWLK